MSKGSRPRPYSVSQQQFGNNYDVIFGKKKKTEEEKFDEQVIMQNEFYDLEDNMQVRVQENDSDVGRCGCGRSPTGKCIGWHGLTEDAFKHQQMLWMEEQERKDSEVRDTTQGG
jgi:hypothetical protein